MGLKVWLPLNGDIENKGTSDIKMTGTPTYGVGKIGEKCLSGAEIISEDTTIPAELSKNNQYTVCVWLKGTAAGVWGWYIGAGTGTTRGLWLGSNGKPSLAYSGSSAYSGTQVINDGVWHHVCFTVNQNISRIYVDGVDCGGSTSIKTDAIAGTTFSIEAQRGYDYNDFRIYDECLSAAQVHEIAKGLVLHYKLDGPMGGSGRNLFRNTNFFKTATNSSPASTTISPAITFADNLQNLVGKTITFSFELYTPGARQNNPSQSNATLAERFGAHLSLNYTPSGGSATQLYPCAQYLTSTITEPNTRVIQTYTVPSDCTINSFSIAVQPYAYPAAGNTATWKIGQFKVEYGDKATSYSPAPEDLGIDTTIVTDSSGYRHNGTITGTLITSSDTPRYSSAINIDDSTSIIRTDSFTSEIYTLTCWAKTTKNKATSQIMVADSLSQMCISFYNNAIISFYGTNGGQGTGSRCVLGNEYKENDWNFFAVVKSGASGERDVYCNGVKLTPTSNSWWSPINGFWIGNRQNGGNAPFYGYISDVRAYCTPLLDTDIKLLYNIGSRIDNLGGIHTYEANENDNNIVSKITEVGQLQSKNIYEQPALLNNATSASYNPTGANNSTMPRVLWADLSSFYKLGQPIQVQVDVDVSWSNITPTGEGTFFCRIQGAKYEAATNTWVWTGPTIVANNYELTTEMLANPTGSTHVSYISLIPATALEEYTRAAFGIRTNYATGTISVSNLKITLIPGTAKINPNYVSGTEFIEM